MENAIPQNMLPIAGVVDRKIPKYRIGTASDAQVIVAQLWNASDTRNLRDAAIQGQVDGNPPFNPTKMRAQGRASDPNFNTLEAKSILSSALVPYYDLFAGDGHYSDIQAEVENASSKSLTEWSEIITEEFDLMLRRWENFDYTIQQMLRDYVFFGKGFLVWEEPKSWRFRKIAHYRVMVPDGTSINLDEIELLVVLNDWMVSDLYSKISNREKAKENGWNIQAVLESIENAVPVDPQIPHDPIGSQQMLRDADLYVSARSSTVQTATLYSREFSGRWSECMVRRDQLAMERTVGMESVNADFLHQRRDQYDSILDLIVPFFFEVMDGSWHGASGLGKDIFVLMQLNDRLSCALAQSAFLRTSLVLQAKQAYDKQRMNLLQVGAVTWIPDGVDVKESTILGDIRTPIDVRRELSIMTERNTGIYRPTLEKGTGNPQTFGEFQSKLSMASALSNSSINRFYDQLDRLYHQQYQRAVKHPPGYFGEFSREAKRFVDRCLSKGVPMEAILKAQVKAWRKVGSGSAGLRTGILQQYMGLWGFLRDQGRENLLRELISTTGSMSQAKRLMPEEDWTPLPSNDQEIALLENAAMKIGAPVTWTPSQNNIVHVQVHLQSSAQAAASVQQGASIHDVLDFIDRIGAHTAVHFQHMGRTKEEKQIASKLVKQWKRLASIADKMRSKVQEQISQQKEQQAKTQAALSDSQLKQLETAGKLDISRQKAEAIMELRRKRQEHDLLLKDEQARSDIAREDIKTGAEIARKRFSFLNGG